MTGPLHQVCFYSICIFLTRVSLQITVVKTQKPTSQHLATGTKLINTLKGHFLCTQTPSSHPPLTSQLRDESQWEVLPVPLQDPETASKYSRGVPGRPSETGPTQFQKANNLMIILCFVNKPSVQVAGADPCRCNATRRQIQSFSQNF